MRNRRRTRLPEVRIDCEAALYSDPESDSEWNVSLSMVLPVFA